MQVQVHSIGTSAYESFLCNLALCFLLLWCTLSNNSAEYPEVDSCAIGHTSYRCYVNEKILGPTGHLVSYRSSLTTNWEVGHIFFTVGRTFGN